jgi:proline iminopeptidase
MRVSSAALREGFIPVWGGRVWYRIVGAERDGIPLLVLHGGPGAPHDYLEPLETLSSERPVIFYDQLGCGNSDKPEDPSLWTVERFVDEVVRVRKALGLDRAHILGQSWGTILAIEYNLSRKPDGVMSLILSGPCLSASRWVADQQAYLTDLPEETRKTILEKEASGEFESAEYQQAVMEFYKRHVCRLDPWPDCVNRTFEKLAVPVYMQMWGPCEFRATGILRDYDSVERLKELRMPVLFTCGRFDEATPSTTLYYRSKLPGSEIAIFEDASHMHHIEKADQYAATVRDFLRRAEGR